MNQPLRESLGVIEDNRRRMMVHVLKRGEFFCCRGTSNLGIENCLRKRTNGAIKMWVIKMLFHQAQCLVTV